MRRHVRGFAVAWSTLGGALAAACLGLLLATATARADTPPSQWDIAKDPFERDRWALHVRVQRLLHPPSGEVEVVGQFRGLALELRLESARAMLEQADAAHSPDIRLQFDLGIVDYELGSAQARHDLLERAVQVLVPALERAPDHPAATDAMERLVYCYVKLNRPEDELATWLRYIPRLTDDRARVVANMNMGEAQMRLGHIDDAVETFRDVLRVVSALPNASSTYILTAWDLAVALDRSGDSRGAVDEASRVLGMGAPAMAVPLPIAVSRAVRGTLILRSSGVFFVPAWEVEWYFALAATADARDARDARDEASSWAEAESHWKTYVDQSAASNEHDPWLPIARVRLSHAQTARIAAEARARRLPRRPVD
jgi:tetratricopeptide (TPR) repeat protein